MDGITDSMDVSLSKRRETVKDGESWLAAASPWGRRESVTGQWEISGVLQSDTHTLLTHVQLCSPMDCSPPGSSVHGSIPARILEPAAISFSRGSPRPRDRTSVSCVSRKIINYYATLEAVKHKDHPQIWFIHKQ